MFNAHPDMQILFKIKWEFGLKNERKNTVKSSELIPLKLQLFLTNIRERQKHSSRQKCKYTYQPVPGMDKSR